MNRKSISAPRRILYIVLTILAAIVAALFVFVLCQTPPTSDPLPKDAADAFALRALPAFGTGALLGEPVALLDQRGAACAYLYPVVVDGETAASIEVTQESGTRTVEALSSPPGGERAVEVLGRPLDSGDVVYAPGAVPFSFAVQNDDGTFFIAYSENGAVRQIPAWNFWLACKAQLTEQTFVR